MLKDTRLDGKGYATHCKGETARLAPTRYDTLYHFFNMMQCCQPGIPPGILSFEDVFSI